MSVTLWGKGGGYELHDHYLKNYIFWKIIIIIILESFEKNIITSTSRLNN